MNKQHPPSRNVLGLCIKTRGRRSRVNCKRFHYTLFLKKITGNYVNLAKYLGFPGGSEGKASAVMQETRFDSWVRKIPWRRKLQPTPVFLPGESHGQRINPNQNYNEVSPHTSQNGHCQMLYKEPRLERVWRNENPPPSMLERQWRQRAC